MSYIKTVKYKNELIDELCIVINIRVPNDRYIYSIALSFSDNGINHSGNDIMEKYRLQKKYFSLVYQKYVYYTGVEINNILFNVENGSDVLNSLIDLEWKIYVDIKYIVKADPRKNIRTNKRLQVAGVWSIV